MRPGNTPCASKLLHACCHHGIPMFCKRPNSDDRLPITLINGGTVTSINTISFVVNVSNSNCEDSGKIASRYILPFLTFKDFFFKCLEEISESCTLCDKLAYYTIAPH